MTVWKEQFDILGSMRRAKIFSLSPKGQNWPFLEMARFVPIFFLKSIIVYTLN